MENLLSKVRNKFRNCDHPIVYNFTEALKSIIISDLLLGSPSSSSNCEADETLFPPLSLCSDIFPASRKSTVPPCVLRSHFSAHLPTHSSSVHVYTDGSKSSDSSGCAVLFPDMTFRYRLPPQASVLATELSAILFALRRIFRLSAASYTVFTDSRSSLSLLSTSPSPHPLVRDIQDWLFRLSSRRKLVRFCWVPSHVGIPGNVAVDSLAHEALTLPNLCFSSLPVSDYHPF